MMKNISQEIEKIKNELPQSVQLVAVSKFHPVEKLMQAYSAGQRAFGESRAQEIVAKYSMMPDDVQWHFIGHLQTNKVKQIVPCVSLIHSIDSVKLLKAVNDEAQKINKKIKVLLQIHVAQEETKYGFAPNEIVELAKNGTFDGYENVAICGIMTMATNTDDEVKIREDFAVARSVFNQLKNEIFIANPDFKELSMGMSDDYKIAMEYGATLVRIGTTIFGEREY